jgi:DNA-binding transcriptional MerR regulator
MRLGRRPLQAFLVRIAELSRRSGVSVPTIKFYLREGLLAPGSHTSRNQASYDETHERRLRLVRALIEVGGLSIAAVRTVLLAADTPVAAVHTLLGEVQRQKITVPAGTEDVLREWADEAVAQLIARRGWQIHPDHPAAQALAGVLITAAQLGHKDFLAMIDKYAVTCEDIAAVEIRSLGARSSTEDVVEGMVLGDAAITSLRRMAQVDASRRLFGQAAATG